MAISFLFFLVRASHIGERLLPSVITSRGICVFVLTVGVRRQICLAGYVDHNFAETFSEELYL